MGDAGPAGSAGAAEHALVRASLAGNAQAPSAAREFVRTALRGWEVPHGPADDVTLLASELVTNAVVHAGTSVGLECRRSEGAVVVEVADGHPTRPVESGTAGDGGSGAVDGGAGGRGHDEEHGGARGRQGHGLRLVAALADEWGVTYRRYGKTVWFRLATGPEATGPEEIVLGAPPVVADSGADAASSPTGTAAPADPATRQAREHAQHERDPVSPRPPGTGPRGSLTGSLAPTAQRPAPGIRRHDPDWIDHGILSFLAEASDLLAGQTDEDRVASLACQLLVPRFADWCAVWLADADAAEPMRLSRVWHTQEERTDELRAELRRTPPELEGRVPRGKAVPWAWPGRASAYGPGGAAVGCRLVVGERTVGTLVIGRAGLIRIPGEVVGIVEDFARRVAQAVLSARRYTRQATISRVLQRGLLPSGDVAVPGVESAVVYEPAGEGSWAGGDFYDFFEGTGGRWRFALGDVCGNGPEAAVVTGLARPVLRLLAREGYSVPEVMDRLNREVGEQTRFLSMIYGELTPRPASEGGGSMCTLVCAGHPLPLVRDAAGKVRAAAEPQLLLGVEEDVSYESQSVVLEPGETLLCVTDGVTERRCGERQFDDDDGLAAVFGDCGGLDAAQTAEKIRRTVHEFGDGAAADDLALLVLRAKPD
ncbi:SpoIIE family protein phosphatase [Streptomyces sp. M600PL45_2]|uniref:SpoIIE family protein phosphatase n=1 Tax=Streptomyces marispadix TaxID=2922868 RepID=A0ABS9SVD2_9ACTN|nr:SpoIIE family protein phosphatase [Streptomyces marispadix]MCH6160232.1 SpoIIE family protein phosphatase [Streptomyces marispadix]